jgi:hypothetical protein
VRKFKVFDQLPTETSRQYLAFCCYRDQGQKRNSQKAYHRYRLETGKISQVEYDRQKGANPSRTFIQWRKEFLWDERARVYDLDVGRYNPFMRGVDFAEARAAKVMEKMPEVQAKIDKDLDRLAVLLGVTTEELRCSHGY